ncbi:MAG: rod shape-determining protein RodA [Planctomycetes bacterium]|nr:rod shape-determining protein RodA [Planctomycetota bacterium]
MPRSLNSVVIIPMLLLTLIGIIAIWSAAPDVSDKLTGLSRIFANQAVKQIAFTLVALLAFGIILLVNYYKLKDYTYALYIGLLVLILLLIAWGRVSHGARRWFQLGPFALQPSEFMKIVLVLMLARIMMHKRNVERFRDLFVPLIVTLIPFGLVFLQPSLGTALLFLPTFVVMVFVSGTPARNIIIMFVVIAIIAPIGYFFVLKDYQRYRLLGFLTPSTIPSSEGFQLIQSKVAVGSGSIIGRGWGEGDSSGSLFVPERHNDFIFTTISEEWGFVGSSLVIVLYLIMYLGAVFIAYNTREPFGRLAILGLVTYLTAQTFINIGMTIGFAPITGLPMPFVSYGGSSLLSSYIAMGLIVNIGVNQLPSFASRDFE